MCPVATPLMGRRASAAARSLHVKPLSLSRVHCSLVCTTVQLRSLHARSKQDSHSSSSTYMRGLLAPHQAPSAVEYGLRPPGEGHLCQNGTIPDWRVYCEDLYQWMDVEDGTWHVLCNSKDCPSRPPEPPDPKPSYPYFCHGHGMHAFSRTGASGTWHWQVEEPAYDNSVEMANGSTVHIGRRERPHLLFHDGRPTHLFTAVTWTSDRSWTFGQALR